MLNRYVYPSYHMEVINYHPLSKLQSLARGPLLSLPRYENVLNVHARALSPNGYFRLFTVLCVHDQKPHLILSWSRQ
jgi:hypothetical protein